MTNSEKADIKGSKPPANIDIAAKMQQQKEAYAKSHPDQNSQAPTSPMGPAGAQGK